VASPDIKIRVSRENHMNQQNRAIILRLPESVIDRLDAVAYTLNMTRSAYIRRSVVRGLEHTEAHELPLLEHRAIRKALAR
jgi:predicted DNA-binding protein